jgi:hypothetical protein
MAKGEAQEWKQIPLRGMTDRKARATARARARATAKANRSRSRFP